jgi:hypothetical protein
MITSRELTWCLNGRDGLKSANALANLLELGLVESIASADGFQIMRTPAGDAVWALTTLAATQE